MRAVYAIWRMLARRSLANWRLAATLALGVLIAATLLASAPIYARSLADLGLTFAIRDKLASAPSTQIEIQHLAINSNEGRTIQDAVARRADERLGWFTHGTPGQAGARERVVAGPRFQIAGVGPRQAGAGDAARPPFAVPWALSSAEAHVRVLQGRMPGRSSGQGERVLEFALAPKAADAVGLKVGDRVTLLEGFDDCEREIPREDRPPPPPCTPKIGVRFQFPALLTGLVEPADPDAPFWVQPAGTLFDPYTLIPDFGPMLPALMDETAFFQDLGAVLPDYRADFRWNYFADPDKLSRANFLRAREDILALRDDLSASGGLGGFAFSPLEGALDSFRRELSYQQTPLLVLLLQIAAIALFYVAIISALVIERQAEEIALLRSRGAGQLQVVGVYLLEGLVIGVPVTLIAPFLAAGATALLGYTPAFRRVTDGGDRLPVHLGAEAFLLAAAGAALSLLMLLGPAFLAARTTGVSSRRQEGRPRQPFFLRYYLDLAVVGLAGVLLWELSERGSVFKPGTTGGLSSDPLLLVSPALLTLGAAALVLRFYPLVLRLAAALLSPVVGTSVALGLWQVVRNPGNYIRLALLLMMAVAVGTFAASYSSTAERSFRDRASYDTGADLRLGIAEGSGTDSDLAGALNGFPGVERASLVLRGQVSPATPGSNRQDMLMLGVDPEAVPSLLWFRDDLADEPLPELMSRLRGAAPRGRPLTGAPTAISIWVNPAEPRENVTMWVRVTDSQGAVTMAELGKLDFSGWRQLRGRLDGPFDPVLRPPLALVSVLFSEPQNVNITQSAPIYLDDITAEGPDGATVIEDFEGNVRWEAAPERVPVRGAAVQDEFKVVGEQRHGGASAGRFVFRPGASTGLRGIFAKDLVSPLPVIVSPGFIAATGAGPGQTTVIQTGDTITPVIVRGVARLFPTISAGTPFLLVNREQLTAWLAAFSDSALRHPNEAWVQLRPDADRRALTRRIATSPERLSIISDRERELHSVNANPLVAAGGSGILLAASLAVFLLVAAALLVTIIAAVQRRRTEFAVLRAMGVSRGQLLRLLSFEYALVAVLGIGVGVFLGEAVGRRMLSFLEVTESGNPVVPPFILQTNWPVVAAAVGVIALTFVAGMLLSTYSVLRTVSGQALRGTE